MTQIVISSVVTGSVYAVMALGLVAVFKTTRVFNFAHGQVAALGAYMGYTVSTDWDLPFLLVVLVGAVVGALTCLLMERLVLARLYHRTALELVVATFGVSLILRSVMLRIWGPDVRTIDAPFRNENVEVLGATISAYGLSLVIFALLVVALLTVVLTRTEVGLRLRATFDDPVAARMQGVRVARVRTASWMLGGALAGTGGVLLTPIIFLAPGTMDHVLIVAFAAAVVGGFSSFYGAFAGGIAVALASNLLAKYVSLGFKDVLLYACVIAFLWLRPHGLFGEAESDEAVHEGETSGALGRRWQAVQAGIAGRVAAFRRTALRGHAPQWLAVAAVIVAFYAAPSVFGTEWELNLMTWLTSFIAVAGLSLMMFYGGRIPLAQNAFMAVGGYATAVMLEGRPGSWPVVLVLAALIAAAAGVLFELPSQRLRGAYYALATLALGLAVPLLALKWTSVTDGIDGRAVEYIQWGGRMLEQSEIHMIIATVATIVLVALLALRNSRIGQAVVAVRDAPEGAASIGIAGAPRRLILAGAAAGLGGLAGSLSAMQNNLVTPSVYSFEFALALFVAAVMAGSIVGSAWGAAVITLVPVLLKNEPVYAAAAYGAIVLLTLFALPRTRDAVDVLRRVRPAAASGRWVEGDATGAAGGGRPAEGHARA